MKYSAIICLFFILVNSKQEKKFKSFLEDIMDEIEEFDEWVEYDNYEQNNDQKNEENDCGIAESEKQCYAIQTLGYFRQCCFITLDYTENGFSEEVCQSFIKPISPFKKMVNSSKFIPLYKEITGFEKFGPFSHGENETIKYTARIKCKDGEASFKVGYDEYTEEDLNILNSKNHCLFGFIGKYYGTDNYKGEIEENDLKPINCEDKILLQSSIDAGFECGYMKIISKKDDIEEIFDTFNSCMLFNKDFYSSIEIPKEVQTIIDLYLELYNSTFSVEFYNGKGKKHSFSFGNKILKDKFDESCFRPICKYLFFLFCLFLI